MIKKILKDSLIFLVFSIARILYLYIFGIELCSDEAYYWRWSKSLSLSYYDHPPLISYAIATVCYIFNSDNEVIVRLPAVLSCFLLTLVIYFFLRLLGKSNLAFLCGLLINGLPIISVGSIIITPDTLYILFWVISAIILYFALEKNNVFLFHISGICFGLSLLSKYNAVLFIISILLYLLILRRFNLKIFIFLGWGIILFLPVIFWNIKHDFISFSYQLTHGFSQREFSLVEFLLSQLGLVSPVCFFIFIYGIYKSFMFWIHNKEELFLYLFCNSAVILIFFLVTSFFSKVEGNWPSGGWIFSCIICGLLLDKFTGKRFKKFFYFAMLSGYLFSLILYLHAVRPIIPLKKDVTNRLYGWKELTHQVSSILTQEKFFLLVTDSYHLAASLEYNSNLKLKVLVVGGKFSQYNLWQAKTDIYKRLKNKNFIFLSETFSLPEKLKEFSKKRKFYKCISILRNKKIIRKVYVYKF